MIICELEQGLPLIPMGKGCIYVPGVSVKLFPTGLKYYLVTGLLVTEGGRSPAMYIGYVSWIQSLLVQDIWYLQVKKN